MSGSGETDGGAGVNKMVVTGQTGTRAGLDRDRDEDWD